MEYLSSIEFMEKFYPILEITILFLITVLILIVGYILISFLKYKMNETAIKGFEEIVNLEDESVEKCICCHEKLTLYVDDAHIDQIKNEFHDINNKNKLLFIYFKYFNLHNLYNKINKRCVNPDCGYYNIKTFTTEYFDKFYKDQLTSHDKY